MILVWAGLIILATFSTKITAKIGVPGLLVFLGIGMLFGSDGFSWIYFDNMLLAQQISNIALIIILFEGGYNVKYSLIRTAFAPAITLATLGIIITTVVTGFFLRFFFGFDWLPAFLLGAIISSTDAAAVFSILRGKALPPKVSATLEVESASNDPMAILLTIAIIGLIKGETQNTWQWIGLFLWQFIGGFGIGWIVFIVGRWLFNSLKARTGGFYYVLILGICFLAYGFAEAVKANGFIAVFFAGVMFGNNRFAFKGGVSHFLEGVSTFAQVLVFLLLGLLVFPKQLFTTWHEGIWIALILIFISRPAAVFLCTMFSKFSQKERLFITWGGVKGAVPIVLATYPAVAGLDPENRLFNIVFFAVLITTLLEGSTLDWIGKKLRLLRKSSPKPLVSMELMALENANVELIEIVLDEQFTASGKLVRELNLPQEVLITAIVRENQLISAKGNTLLRSSDLLFVLTPTELSESISEYFICNESFAADTDQDT
jgi:cell volume regulation protein A